MYIKMLFCVQRLSRMEIVPDYAGVCLGRFYFSMIQKYGHVL